MSRRLRSLQGDAVLDAAITVFDMDQAVLLEHARELLRMMLGQV